MHKGLVYLYEPNRGGRKFLPGRIYSVNVFIGRKIWSVVIEFADLLAFEKPITADLRGMVKTLTQMDWDGRQELEIYEGSKKIGFVELI